MGSLSRETDEALIVATAADPEAFAVFYRRHVAAVLGWFGARTKDSQQALDLTAETFARALEHAASFAPAGSGARPWLFAIARNLLIDSYRRGQVESDARTRLNMEPLVVTDSGFERVEASADAAAALSIDDLEAELTPDQLRAITGRVLEGRSYESLAGDLACSPQVVRQHVSRGLRKLRRSRKASA